jgi:putative FmdB family regulatory protein
LPILEYHCDACDHQFEKLVRGFNAPSKIVCPSCGSSDVHKLVSTFGVSGVQPRSGGGASPGAGGGGHAHSHGAS